MGGTAGSRGVAADGTEGAEGHGVRPRDDSSGGPRPGDTPGCGTYRELLAWGAVWHIRGRACPGPSVPGSRREPDPPGKGHLDWAVGAMAVTFSISRSAA